MPRLCGTGRIIGDAEVFRPPERGRRIGAVEMHTTYDLVWQVAERRNNVGQLANVDCLELATTY